MSAEHLLLWVDQRDGIATPAIRDNGGAWVYRCFIGGINHDGPCNYDLPEHADPVLLARWVSRRTGWDVVLTRASTPRSLVPRRLRGCASGTAYRIGFISQ